MSKVIYALSLILAVSTSLPQGHYDLQVQTSVDGRAVNGGTPTKFVPEFKSVGRERALAESETLLSQLDSKYTGAHQFFATFNGAKPVVDVVSEADKYGNDAALSRGVATAIVKAFDGVAVAGNKILDAPYEKLNYLSKTATAALNSVGAKLVGL